MPKIKNIVQGFTIQFRNGDKTHYIIGRMYNDVYKLFDSEKDFVETMVTSSTCSIGLIRGRVKVKIIKGKKK